MVLCRKQRWSSSHTLAAARLSNPKVHYPLGEETRTVNHHWTEIDMGIVIRCGSLLSSRALDLRGRRRSTDRSKQSRAGGLSRVHQIRAFHRGRPACWGFFLPILIHAARSDEWRRWLCGKFCGRWSEEWRWTGIDCLFWPDLFQLDYSLSLGRYLRLSFTYLGSAERR